MVVRMDGWGGGGFVRAARAARDGAGGTTRAVEVMARADVRNNSLFVSHSSCAASTTNKGRPGAPRGMRGHPAGSRYIMDT